MDALWTNLKESGGTCRYRPATNTFACVRDGFTNTSRPSSPDARTTMRRAIASRYVGVSPKGSIIGTPHEVDYGYLSLQTNPLFFRDCLHGTVRKF